MILNNLNKQYSYSDIILTPINNSLKNPINFDNKMPLTNAKINLNVFKE